MKRVISFLMSFVILASLYIPAFASNTTNPINGRENVIVEEYNLADSDIVFTMELFERTYTRQDVANMIALEKAKEAPQTNQYVSFEVSEAEIDEFYKNVEAIAAQAPGLAYYFSNVYWQYRCDKKYMKQLLTLTLVTTEVTRNNRELEVTMASWTLVKAECGSSPNWTNEGSLEQQFRCHALGEIWYPGEVGNWDLEPIRPDTGLFEYIINQCNPGPEE